MCEREIEEGREGVSEDVCVCDREGVKERGERRERERESARWKVVSSTYSAVL